MLNNRKSMLALLLGMSLAVTFPVGVDASDKGGHRTGDDAGF